MGGWEEGVRLGITEADDAVAVCDADRFETGWSTLKSLAREESSVSAERALWQVAAGALRPLAVARAEATVAADADQGATSGMAHAHEILHVDAAVAALRECAPHTSEVLCIAYFAGLSEGDLELLEARSAISLHRALESDLRQVSSREDHELSASGFRGTDVSLGAEPSRRILRSGEATLLPPETIHAACAAFRTAPRHHRVWIRVLAADPESRCLPLLDQLFARFRAEVLLARGAEVGSSQPSDRDSLRRARGRYRLGTEHARGGMGRILKARDLTLDRTVAIKEALRDGDAFEQRFMREAKLTARLQHPSIVPVYDAGRWDDSNKCFYAMRLVGGESLSEVVEAQTSLRERMGLLPNVLAVMDAVAYAHSEGVIHRDLKPQNVLVGAYGETLVVDWGIAKALRAPTDEETTELSENNDIGSDLTEDGSVLGTPRYMPPEQAHGASVDFRADVYALGAILYFLLAGQSPYHGAEPGDALRLVRDAPPTHIAQLQPLVPRDLSAIVDKAMAREPVARYATAEQLAADLRRYLTGRMVNARRYSPWQMFAHWLRQHRAVAMVGGAAIAFVVGGSLLFAAREQGLRRAAEVARQRADAQSLALITEQGKRELGRGRPLRASVPLTQAYAAKPEDLALRHAVTAAVRPLSAHLAHLQGHERDVVAVAFGTDGRRVATGSTDRTVRLWAARTGRLERVFEGTPGSIEDVVLSPDGRWVASTEQVTLVWNAETGELVRELAAPGFRLEFSLDGRWLAVGSMSGRLFIWDTEDWRLAAELHPHNHRIAAIEFDPSGSRALTASWDGKVILWSLPGWTPERILNDHFNDVVTADYSPDGRLLITGDKEFTLSVRRANDGSVLHHLRLPEGSRAMNAFFTPDSRRIVTGTFDGVIRVWHASNGSLLSAVDSIVEGRLFDAALSPDGVTVATVGLDGGDLWRLDQTPQPELLRGEVHAPTAIYPGVISADGRRLVAGIETLSGSHPATVRVWDLTTKATLGSWAVPSGILGSYSLAASADLSRVVTGYGRDKTILSEAPSGRQIARLQHPKTAGWVRDLAITRDGSLIASGADDGKLRLWNGSDGAPLGELAAFEAGMTALDFSPDGLRLASTDSRGNLRLHHVVSRVLQTTIAAHPTWIESVEFSADGRWLVTAGRQDHLAKVWNVETGKIQATMQGHGAGLSSASFSPDASLVVTASVDNTARLWNAKSGALLRVIKGPAFTARVSPDGSTLVTTGFGDYLALWDIGTDPRPASAMTTLVEQRSPWRLEEGRIVPRRVSRRSP